MEKVEILCVCSNDGILKTILRLINNYPQWNSTGAGSASEAISILADKDFALVLIGSGLAPDQEQQLESVLAARAKQVPVIKHYGGGSGLLFGEIHQALAGRPGII